MFDMEAIDKLYEATVEKGSMRFALFDKRVLLPLRQLPEAVAKETGEEITEEDLRAKVAKGWFPLLAGAGDDGSDAGVPLYIPSRIGLFLKLQREAYGEDELRLIASIEESSVENVLTVDDLAYVDDDLETLILQAEGRVDAGESALV
jgi:hypothetical protein